RPPVDQRVGPATNELACRPDRLARAVPRVSPWASRARKSCCESESRRRRSRSTRPSGCQWAGGCPVHSRFRGSCQRAGSWEPVGAAGGGGASTGSARGVSKATDRNELTPSPPPRPTMAWVVEQARRERPNPSKEYIDGFDDFADSAWTGNKGRGGPATQAIDDLGRPPHCRRAARDHRLVARVRLPGGRHDLPEGQPAA